MATSNSTNSPTRPDYERQEYRDGKQARALCQDLMAGSEAIRAGGEAYLPKWPAEKPEHYKIRASITQVARYYERTVQASVGMILSTPPTLGKDTDPVIVKDWEDIDGKGTHGEVFLKYQASDAINGGFVGVLVDAPPIPDGVTITLEDEQKLGLRPFWVPVTADQLISWIVEVPDWAALVKAYATGTLTAEQVAGYAKQSVVRQVVIHEPTDTVSGKYGTTSVDRYRVLQLTDAGVTFAVWEKVKPKAGTAEGEHFIQRSAGAMKAAGGVPFREIPLAIWYGGRRIAPFVASPPLLGLGELNLDHYQVSADRRYLMRLCHAPTLYLFGVEDEIDEETGRKVPIRVGPNSVVTSANAQAKMGYAAADSHALTSSKEEKEELVRQMAVLGMSFIGKDKRGMAETATGRALDDAAENASHATVARGLQDGAEQALRFHAMYRGVKAPSITVNTTYASPQVDPQIVAVLWQAVAADKLDVESWIEYVKTGALPDDIAERLELLRLVASEAANNDAATASADKNKTDAAGTKAPNLAA